MSHIHHAASLDDAAYRHIARDIEEGAVILYPTETVYGLGCNARDRAAIQRIYDLKKRPPDKALLMLVRDKEMLSEFAREVPPALEALTARFWPGPLTLVLEAKPGKLPLDLLSPGHSTIAVRVSPHPFCKSLMAHLKAPLVSTSANLSGEKNPLKFEDVNPSICRGVDVAVDGGDLSQGGMGAPSSIVGLKNGKPVLLREGALSKAQLGIN